VPPGSTGSLLSITLQTAGVVDRGGRTCNSLRTAGVGADRGGGAGGMAHMQFCADPVEPVSITIKRALLHSDINNDKISISSQPSRQLHRMLQ
jgi:hypothetical protein